MECETFTNNATKKNFILLEKLFTFVFKRLSFNYTLNAC